MINNVVLMGRITKDLEPRQTQNGKIKLSFTVAVDRGYGDNKQTDFINCVAWEKRAQFIDKYFHKGSLIALTGSIKTGSYEKDGRTIYTTEVWVDEASFTGEKKTDSSPIGDGYTELEDPDGVPF